jgi:hypothetical protein
MGLQYFRSFCRYDSGNLAAPLVFSAKARQDKFSGFGEDHLPNSDNVYLHGTDVPELFSQDVRDSLVLLGVQAGPAITADNRRLRSKPLSGVNG